MTQFPKSFSEVVIVRDNHPTLTGGDVLHRMEAEHGHVSLCADWLVVPRPAKGVTRIPNHGQVVLISDFEESLNVCWVAAVVHRNNSFGRGSDLFANCIRIECSTIWVDISEHRRRPTVGCHMCR